MEASRFLPGSFLVGLLLVFLAVSVSAAPLEITGSDLGGFDDGELTGGEEVSIDVNFTNTLDRPLDFLMVLEFSSKDVSVRGPEFPVSTFLGRFNGKLGVTCNTYQNVSFHAFSFYCGEGAHESPALDSTMTAGPGSNNLSMNFSTNIRIVPAEYELTVDLRSWPGSLGSGGGSSSNMSEGKLESIPLNDGSDVGVRPEKRAEAAIIPLDSLFVPSPSQDSSLEKAYKVQVYEENFNASNPAPVNASGYLNLSYSESLDEASREVGVYRYRPSEDGWVDVTDARYRGANRVFANVSHFSTYALYSSQGDQQDDEGTQNGDEGGGGFPSVPGGDPSPSEPQNNDSGQENESEQDPAPEEEDPGDEGEQDEDGDTGEQDQDNDPQQPGETSGSGPEQGSWVDQLRSWLGDEGLTGYASQSPGAGFLGFLVVVAALLLVLQYSGKADVKGRAEDVFQRVRP